MQTSAAVIRAEVPVASRAVHNYRITHYGADGHVYLKAVRLLWSWDWRYGRDPVFECRTAAEKSESLMDRARRIAAEMNAAIATGCARPNDRRTLLRRSDAVDPAARHAIWQDLITVQITMATLSALAVKASIEAMQKRER
jgi:hypothetical protein